MKNSHPHGVCQPPNIRSICKMASLSVHIPPGGKSQSVVWETPKWLFDRYNSQFLFSLDVCACPFNAKCKQYFTEADDGLAQAWGDNICWMNPPYGKEIASWIEKAYRASLKGATVVALLPSRTDTRWWHQYVTKGEITYLKGRLKFRNIAGHAETSAPFPSAVVVFRPSKRSVLDCVYPLF